MMNNGLKAGLLWNHYSVSSAGAKEFQNEFFNYLCWRRGRRKGGKRKQAREDEKAEGKEGNGGMTEQTKYNFFCLEH